jgi:hypothetical protein
MPMQGSLKVERMCELARVSRAGFYRSLKEQVPVEESMEVRSAIQRIALEHRRRYGYRRVTAELKRCGMAVKRCGGTDHAGRQPAGGPAQAVRQYHGLQARYLFLAAFFHPKKEPAKSSRKVLFVASYVL